MHATTGQKHCIAPPHTNPMKTVRDRPGLDFLLKLLARYSAFKSNKKFSPWRSIGDIPHLGLRFAAQLGGYTSWRMNLQRKRLLRIKNLQQQRESSIFRFR